mmetsp:Transcript_37534/g.82321  ORF Transcript_37534/g.82321 Transcript_37534/m.82321 type:complete len:268 (-) Transcript_37534:7-810(-)
MQEPIANCRRPASPFRMARSRSVCDADASLGSVLVFCMCLLRVSDFLVHLAHVRVRHRREERILNGITRDSEAPETHSLVVHLPVWPVAERVVVSVVWFIVYHAPLVRCDAVAQAMVEVGQRVGPLAVTVWQLLLVFLLTAVDVRVEKPVPVQDPESRPSCEGRHPPVVVRRYVADPCVQKLLVEVIRNRWIGLILQENRVTLAEGKGRPIPGLGVSRQVLGTTHQRTDTHAARRREQERHAFRENLAEGGSNAGRAPVRNVKKNGP